MARPYNELGKYGGVGLDLVLSILVLGAIGHWLDQRYWPGHDNAMMVGGLLGVAVAVRNLIRAAKSMQRDIEIAEAKDPEAGQWKVDEGWLHPPPDATQEPPPDDERRD